MHLRLKEWLYDESGATAIEYGLIAVCISLAIALASALMGADIASVFDRLAAALPQ